MRTTIQKTVSVFFLFLSLSPLLTILVFSVRKEIIQFEMKKKLRSHELQTIIIPEQKVKWVEDHEIWVNESMFDIRTKKLENGIYTFTGMYDKEETALVSKQRNAAHTQQEENKMIVQVFHCLRNLYNEPLPLPEVPPISRLCYGPTASIVLPDFIPAIPTPPPQPGLL